MSATIKHSVELECNICRSYGYFENFTAEPVDFDNKITMVDGWALKTSEATILQYSCICPECYKYFVSAKSIGVDVAARRSELLKGLVLARQLAEFKKDRVENKDNNEGNN